MGNQNSKEDFQFPDHLQIINDEHADKGYYELQDKRDGALYIGRHIKSNDHEDESQKQQIIAEKVDNPSPFVTQLLEDKKSQEQTYCSNQTIFHLLFRKVSKTLTEQIQTRRKSGKSFTVKQVDNTITRATKGLKYLYNINHEHGHISTDAISWPTSPNQNVMLIDEWALNKFETSPNKQCLGSKNKEQQADEKQQKLSYDLYSVGNIGMQMLGGNFDPKIRRKFHNKYNDASYDLLRQKLEILCSKDEQKRLQIYKLYEKIDLEPHQIQINKSPQEIAQNKNVLSTSYSQFTPKSTERPNLNVQRTHTYPIAPSQPQRSSSNFYKNKNNFNNNYYPPHPKSITSQSSHPTPIKKLPSAQFHRFPPQKNLQKVNFASSSQPTYINNNLVTAPSLMPNQNNQYQGIPSASFVSQHVAKINQSEPQTAKFNTINHSMTNQSSAGVVKFMNNSQQPEQFFYKSKNSFQNPKVTQSYGPTNKIEPFAAKMAYSFTIGDNDSSPNRELNAKIEQENKQINNIFQNLKLLGSPYSNKEAGTPVRNIIEDQNRPAVDKQKHHMSTQAAEGDKSFNFISPSPHKYESAENSEKKKIEEQGAKQENSYTQIYAISPENNIKVNISDSKKEDFDQQTPPRYGVNSNIVTTIPQLSESANSVTDEEREYVVEEYQNGSKYEGFKSNGMRNGKGKFYYQEGSFYDGDWKNNNMHGYGKLYYSNNKIAYEGKWYMDQFHGQGKVYNDEPEPLEGMFDYTDFENLDEQWIYYEGTLISDSKEGYGVLVLSNRERYEGEFQNDNIHGKGKYYRLSGQVVHGIWKNSILEKKLAIV